jgi:hypothetical protein
MALSLIFCSSQSHQAIDNSFSICSSVNLYLTTLAGLPATIAYGGTSLVTVEPAATIAPLPDFYT